MKSGRWRENWVHRWQTRYDASKLQRHDNGFQFAKGKRDFGVLLFASGDLLLKPFPNINQAIIPYPMTGAGLNKLHVHWTAKQWPV